MIRHVLDALLLATAVSGQVAPSQAQELPTGAYEPYFTGWDGALNYWLAGDITIEPGNAYSFQNERGRYVMDRATGRLTFTGGALDGAYAVVRQGSSEPAILIPRKQNSDLGRDYAISDIWAYRRK